MRVRSPDCRFGSVSPGSAHREVDLALPRVEERRARLVHMVGRQRTPVKKGWPSRPGLPISWPAEKCLPAPVRTMTRSVPSSVARRNALSSAHVICEFCALLKPGRFKVIHATLSCASNGPVFHLCPWPNTLSPYNYVPDKMTRNAPTLHACTQPLKDSRISPSRPIANPLACVY